MCQSCGNASEGLRERVSWCATCSTRVGLNARCARAFAIEHVTLLSRYRAMFHMPGQTGVRAVFLGVSHPLSRGACCRASRVEWSTLFTPTSWGLLCWAYGDSYVASAFRTLPWWMLRTAVPRRTGSVVYARQYNSASQQGYLKPIQQQTG